jgi:hypothetical protein
MQFTRLAAVLLLFSASHILSSCSSPAANDNKNSVANSTNSVQAGPNDNIDEFTLLVRLPVEPEEVAWREYPEQKKLIAVVRFAPENAPKMAAEIGKNGQPTNETISVETWFPAELIAQSDVTGESIVKGQSYPAEPFLNPPYTKGKITRVENTDYFIIQISS